MLQCNHAVLLSEALQHKLSMQTKHMPAAVLIKQPFMSCVLCNSSLVHPLLLSANTSSASVFTGHDLELCLTQLLTAADDKVSSRAWAEQAKSPPSAKPKADTVRDSKSHERRSARSPTKAAAGKGSERSGARREVAVAKQAGKKRHSRSPDCGRSPKRRASPPDKRSLGGSPLHACSCLCLKGEFNL